jgi:DNA-binding FadR family transcriptional regulator
MPRPSLDSDLLRYIVEHQVQPGERLPTINELGDELGVSVSKIREELEVARALGMVQVKPRTGTLVQEFNFGPAATLSVLYALGLNRAYFRDFSRLRNNVELSFWHDAVSHLTVEDIAFLRQLVARAHDKLNHHPIEVPFDEHRDLHLTFFKRLENPFVQGLLEAYWAAYKAFGLELYAELSYHHEVWDYHERMVECVAQKDFDGGLQALKDHMALLRHRAEETQTPAANVYHFFE